MFSSAQRYLPLSVVTVLAGCMLFALSGSAYAQLGGGGPGDGGGGPVDMPPDDQLPPDDGATFGGGGGGGGGGTGTGEQVDLEGAASLDLGGSDSDDRNQGFIGATAPGVVERNFVGSASQTFGALAEDATFGGGVNDGTQIRIPSANGQGGIGGGRSGAGGFGGAQTSGIVFRSSLRTRLRPAFRAPTVSSQIMVNRFNDNFSRQLGTQAMTGRYQVSIANRTAVLTGSVGSVTESNRLERQLRLQPGVYKIDNRLTIAPQ